MSLLHHDFMSEYELMLSAWGEGVLRESDLLDIQKPDTILSEFRKEYRRDPKEISLLIEDSSAFGYCYTGVDAALLEKLTTLKELILPDSIESINLTPKLKKILQDNKTLIRGSFDSFAARFAAENDLRFRHADFIFACYAPEHFPESTTLTMQFKRDGSAVIEESISSPGTSSSNTLGGNFYHRLSKRFWEELTAEAIAAQFKSGLYTAILEDGRLADFIKKAKTHPQFTGKN